MSAMKTTKVRGLKNQPRRFRYTGRNPRALRRVQYVLSFVKGRELTPEERGALSFFSTPLGRDDHP